MGTAYLVQSDQFSEKLFPHMHEASHSPCRQSTIYGTIIINFLWILGPKVYGWFSSFKCYLIIVLASFFLVGFMEEGKFDETPGVWNESPSRLLFSVFYTVGLSAKSENINFTVWAGRAVSYSWGCFFIFSWAKQILNLSFCTL